MKAIDLTQMITPDMPVYPGTNSPEIIKTATHDKEGYLEQQLVISTHTGTHIDAPAHILKGAPSLDKIEVSNFCGTASCLDFTHKITEDSRICIDDLAPFEELIAEHEFIILNTGWYDYWGSPKYYSGYPALTPEAARWLSDFELKGIGVDVISVDPLESEDFTVHQILLKANISIIENLTNLKAIKDNSFIFSCFPLKITNADGSPIRAVAFCND